MLGKTIWLSEFQVIGFGCGDLNILKYLSPNVK